MKEYWIGSLGKSRSAIVNKVAKEDFTEKVTLEQKLAVGRATNLVDIR